MKFQTIFFGILHMKKFWIFEGQLWWVPQGWNCSSPSWSADQLVVAELRGVLSQQVGGWCRIKIKIDSAKLIPILCSWFCTLHPLVILNLWQFGWPHIRRVEIPCAHMAKCQTFYTEKTLKSTLPTSKVQTFLFFWPLIYTDIFRNISQLCLRPCACALRISVWPCNRMIDWLQWLAKTLLDV